MSSVCMLCARGRAFLAQALTIVESLGLRSWAPSARAVLSVRLGRGRVRLRSCQPGRRIDVIGDAREYLGMAHEVTSGGGRL
jgi:hypothetical protein